MMTSMAGLGLSSGLWLTAMAANPVGVAMLAERGVEITFLSWFLASSVPTISCMLVIPLVLYKLFPPRHKATPQAPMLAAEKLASLGPMSRHELITLGTFVGMVLAWSLAGVLGLDVTAITFFGLAILMLGGVFTLDDIKASGEALEILLWFGILYTLSTQLDQLGCMQYVGDMLGGLVAGFSWPITYVLLVVMYVLIHYLFVSQSAHLLATNFFSVITPQGSSCNVLFIGSGYITGKEVYRHGGVVTLVCLLIYLIIGTPWIMWVLG